MCCFGIVLLLILDHFSDTSNGVSVDQSATLRRRSSRIQSRRSKTDTSDVKYEEFKLHKRAVSSKETQSADAEDDVGKYSHDTGNGKATPSRGKRFASKDCKSGNIFNPTLFRKSK